MKEETAYMLKCEGKMMVGGSLVPITLGLVCLWCFIRINDLICNYMFIICVLTAFWLSVLGVLLYMIGNDALYKTLKNKN